MKVNCSFPARLVQRGIFLRSDDLLWLETGMHVGTHDDGPFHYVEGGGNCEERMKNDNM